MAAIYPLTYAQYLDQLYQAEVWEFIEYQQYLQDRFELYRRGDRDHTESLDDIKLDAQYGDPARLNRIHARRVPRVNYTGRLNDNKRTILERVARNAQRSYANVGAVNPAGVVGVQRNQAVAEVQRAGWRMNLSRADRIQDLTRDFTFVKILGAGGNGMVVLWKFHPERGPPARQQQYDVVMKITLEQDQNGPRHDLINRERSRQLSYTRAPHIVQPFHFAHFVPAPIPPPQARRLNNLQGATGLLFMHYAKLGDMNQCIQKAAKSSRYLPPEALWVVFDCLVKACIDMEYPPIYVNAAGGGLQALPYRGGFLPEVIPPNGLAMAGPGFRGTVHFDLDPRNIFLFGYDSRRATQPLNPDHTQVPRFQVGDFGLSRTSSQIWRRIYASNDRFERMDRRNDVWRQREMAKHRWFLPEQFTAEWDLLLRDPEQAPPNRPPGAPPWPAWDRWPLVSGPGRYSHRSNIWHIGLDMWCFLLETEPDFPPVAGRMRSEEPPIVPPAIDVPFADQRWTYGYRLIAPGDAGDTYRYTFSTALCETIAKCMMARQEHRPDLNQLQAAINAAINPQPRLPGTVRRFFGAEASPPMPWRGAYMGVDLTTTNPFDPYPGEGPNLDDFSPRPRRRRRTRQAPEDSDASYRP